MAWGAKEIREELETSMRDSFAYAMAQDAFDEFYADAGPLTIEYLDNLKSLMEERPDDDKVWREADRTASDIGKIMNERPGGKVMAGAAYRVVMDWLAP